MSIINELSPKPIITYPPVPNKEDCIEIHRTGLAPKGKYCGGCMYFCIELEPRINPWNDEVERVVNIPKCRFFDEPLLATEDTKAPCGMQSKSYIKCISCMCHELDLPKEAILTLLLNTLSGDTKDGK